MPLADLPHEIVALIVHTALDVSTVPSDVLRVCKLFHDLGTALLYTHLRFTSAHQLRQFALAYPRAHAAPRTLSVDLLGNSERGFLSELCDVLLKCQALGASGARLGRIRLRMHSYARDADVGVLERGLQAVSPDVFTWTGPDPEHHFSIAFLIARRPMTGHAYEYETKIKQIVAPVAACLFKQFPSWRSVREITVTNISFATSSDPEGQYPPLLEDVPSLRCLYIGQATFLHPQAVAGTLGLGRMAQLEVIRLVDAYPASIWGPRLRKSDVEKAVTTLFHTEEQTAMIARVRKVVTCEKKTERIMGGDRVEGTYVLD